MRLLAYSLTILLIAFPKPATAQLCDPVDLVCRIASYDPGQYNAGTPYVPPDTTQCGAFNDATKKDNLRHALAAAPAKLQQEICNNLTNIIITDNGYAWGFWENPVTKSTGLAPNTYIGVPDSALTQSLVQEEDATEKNVLRDSVTFSHEANDLDAKFGLLAVIAHEIGHIIWHRDSIYSPFISLPCYYDTFVGSAGTKSWKRGPELYKTLTRFWHPPPSEDSASGDAKHEDSSLSHPPLNPPKNATQVGKLLSSGFVTPFASVSPEEDFVETYKLLALANTPALKLTLHIKHPGKGDFLLLPADQADQSTKDKRDCVAQLME